MPLTYLDSIAEPIFVQLLICISPFRRQGESLVTSTSITVYSCIYIFVYVMSAIVAILNIQATVSQVALQDILSYGYLTLVIAVLELAYTLCTFPMFLIAMQFTRQMQINVLLRIAKIDALLIAEFPELDLQPFYVRLMRKQRIEMSLGAVYFAFMSCMLMWLLELFHFRSFGFQLFAVIYIVEQTSTGLVSWSYTNAVHVMWARFCHLGRAQEIIQEDASAIVLKRRLSVLMGTFRDSCDLIESINGDMGLLLVIRVGHDFTLLLSQSYMLFWLIRTADMWQLFSGYGVLMMAGALWMVQNVMRLLGSTFWTSRVVDEVSGMYKFWCNYKTYFKCCARFIKGLHVCQADIACQVSCNGRRH